jgi:hypothetical protein
MPRFLCSCLRLQPSCLYDSCSHSTSLQRQGTRSARTMAQDAAHASECHFAGQMYCTSCPAQLILTVVATDTPVLKSPAKSRFQRAIMPLARGALLNPAGESTLPAMPPHGRGANAASYDTFQCAPCMSPGTWWSLGTGRASYTASTARR